MKELKQDEENDPALMNANRPGSVFKAYKIESDWFKTPCAW